MNSFNFFVFLIIIFMFNCTYAQKSIKYNLTKPDIGSVSYELGPDSTYSISIKLNKNSTKEFERLTKNNIGNFLRIYKNRHLIQEAIIKVGIPNGRISINNLRDSSEVIYYIKILLE